MNLLDKTGLSYFWSKIKDTFYTKEETDNLISSSGGSIDTTSIINLVYPVGSYYISANSTSPAELFGVGTWEQIKDTFILGAGDTYENGDTGGEAEHTLTVDEMAEHTHSFTGTSHTHTFTGTKQTGSFTMADNVCLNTTTNKFSTASGICSRSTTSTTTCVVGATVSSASNAYNYITINITPSGSNSSTTAGGTNSSTGGGEAHNNMPPYIVRYIWERTA